MHAYYYNDIDNLSSCQSVFCEVSFASLLWYIKDNNIRTLLLGLVSSQHSTHSVFTSLIANSQYARRIIITIIYSSMHNTQRQYIYTCVENTHKQSKHMPCINIYLLTGGNNDGLALFNYLTGKILTDHIKTMHISHAIR